MKYKKIICWFSLYSLLVMIITLIYYSLCYMDKSVECTISESFYLCFLIVSGPIVFLNFIYYILYIKGVR